MQAIRQLFNFYIKASIHVAVSVLALVLLTNYTFQHDCDLAICGFAFFGCVFGYNFIKYESVFRNKKPISIDLKAIAVLSVVSFLASALFFFRLERSTQITALFFFGVTFLYTIPVFSKKKNIRNWSGIKIYVVAICWSSITTLLPLLNAETTLATETILHFGQRFLLVIVLILIFEIMDLKTDDLALQTVPQKIGVKKTKILGIVLLILFFALEFLKSPINAHQLLVAVILVIVTSIFMIFATENRSKYYTSFWVESIPVFWLALAYFL